MTIPWGDDRVGWPRALDGLLFDLTVTHRFDFATVARYLSKQARADATVAACAVLDPDPFTADICRVHYAALEREHQEGLLVAPAGISIFDEGNLESRLDSILEKTARAAAAPCDGSTDEDGDETDGGIFGFHDGVGEPVFNPVPCDDHHRAYRARFDTIRPGQEQDLTFVEGDDEQHEGSESCHMEVDISAHDEDDDEESFWTRARRSLKAGEFVKELRRSSQPLHDDGPMDITCVRAQSLLLGRRLPRRRRPNVAPTVAVKPIASDANVGSRANRLEINPDAIRAVSDIERWHMSHSGPETASEETAPVTFRPHQQILPQVDEHQQQEPPGTTEEGTCEGEPAPADEDESVKGAEGPEQVTRPLADADVTGERTVMTPIATLPTALWNALTSDDDDGHVEWDRYTVAVIEDDIWVRVDAIMRAFHVVGALLTVVAWRDRHTAVATMESDDEPAPVLLVAVMHAPGAACDQLADLAVPIRAIVGGPMTSSRPQHPLHLFARPVAPLAHTTSTDAVVVFTTSAPAGCVADCVRMSLDNGLDTISARTCYLTQAQVDDLSRISVHAPAPEAPAFVLLVRGHRAAAVIEDDVLGPVDPVLARLLSPGSIRARYGGADRTANVAFCTGKPTHLDWWWARRRPCRGNVNAPAVPVAFPHPIQSVHVAFDSHLTGPRTGALLDALHRRGYTLCRVGLRADPATGLPNLHVTLSKDNAGAHIENDLRRILSDSRLVGDAAGANTLGARLIPQWEANADASAGTVGTTGNLVVTDDIAVVVVHDVAALDAILRGADVDLLAITMVAPGAIGVVVCADNVRQVVASHCGTSSAQIADGLAALHQVRQHFAPGDVFCAGASLAAPASRSAANAWARISPSSPWVRRPQLSSSTPTTVDVLFTERRIVTTTVAVARERDRTLWALLRRLTSMEVSDLRVDDKGTLVARVTGRDAVHVVAQRAADDDPAVYTSATFYDAADDIARFPHATVDVSNVQSMDTDRTIVAIANLGADIVGRCLATLLTDGLRLEHARLISERHQAASCWREGGAWPRAPFLAVVVAGPSAVRRVHDMVGAQTGQAITAPPICRTRSRRFPSTLTAMFGPDVVAAPSTASQAARLIKACFQRCQ